MSIEEHMELYLGQGMDKKICDETGGKRQRCRKKRYLPGTFIGCSSTCIEKEKKIVQLGHYPG